MAKPIPDSSQTIDLDTEWQLVDFGEITGHDGTYIAAAEENAEDVLVRVNLAGQPAPSGGILDATFPVPPGSTADLMAEGGCQNDLYLRMRSGTGTARVEAWLR